MKLCTYCGSEMADNAEFCSCCGARLSSTQPPAAQKTAANTQNQTSSWDKPNQNEVPNAAWDKPNQNDLPNAAWDRGRQEPKPEIKISEGQKDDGFLWTLISFFIPLVGLILWLMWKDEKPLDAMSAAKGALVSVSLGFPIVGFVAFFMMKGIYKSAGKACLIASIIGCFFFMFTFMIGLL